MKIRPSLRSSFSAGILGVIFVLTSVGSAQSQILLTVDITNPDAVVFTATGNGPSGTVTGYTFSDGIDLASFFTDDVGTGLTFLADPTTLTTGDASSGTLFDTGASTFSGNEQSHLDLSLFSGTSGAAMSFTSGDAALTGSLTLSLNGQPLPQAGTSHALLAGYATNTTPIGSYLVVETPEPSTWTLIVLGFITLALVRGRRARSCKVSGQ